MPTANIETDIASSHFHILDTGYCHTFAATLLRGLPWQPIRCHCLVALLHHPQHGWVLWDTGYAPRMVEATRRFPWRFYRFVTPFHLQPELSLLHQITSLGLTPDDITHVLVSHLHADHVAGLRDFPRAKFVVARAAWEDARVRQGINALRRAILPVLIPEDFADRTVFVDAFSEPVLGALGPTFDLFGDGSFLLFPLPGHARGQLGLLAKIRQTQPAAGMSTEEPLLNNTSSATDTSDTSFLFAADSCLHRASAYTGKLPSRLTYLIADDIPSIAHSIQRLQAFVRENPNITIIPTHCPKAYCELMGAEP